MFFFTLLTINIIEHDNVMSIFEPCIDIIIKNYRFKTYCRIVLNTDGVQNVSSPSLTYLCNLLFIPFTKMSIRYYFGVQWRVKSLHIKFKLFNLFLLVKCHVLTLSGKRTAKVNSSFENTTHTFSEKVLYTLLFSSFHLKKKIALQFFIIVRFCRLLVILRWK